MVAAVAAGYAAALQERTRAEQERVTTAAFVARAGAEHARWASEARFGALFADAAIGIATWRTSSPTPAFPDATPGIPSLPTAN